MQISSRFTIAIHIFSCINTFEKEHKITSDFLAGSVNVNPVIIRKLLSQLKAAGLVNVQRGSGGASIARPLDQITFLDIYNAVECVDKESFFISTKTRILNVPLAETSTVSLMINCSRCRKQWNARCRRSLLLT